MLKESFGGHPNNDNNDDLDIGKMNEASRRSSHSITY